MIAALSFIEPFVAQLAAVDKFYGGEEWAKLRRPGLEAFVRHRVGSLSKALGEKRHLDGDRFTAGDLMMTTMLRILRHTDLVAEHPNLAGYQARCEARPAFERALQAQLAPFKKQDRAKAA